MPHDWPELPDLVRTAREFVDGVTPRLDGQNHYHALCTSYLLGIVERELDEWGPLETADDARLRGLLGDGGTVPRTALTEALCRDIREGRFDGRMDALLDTLIEHVRAKVAVTKPSFLETD